MDLGRDISSFHKFSRFSIFRATMLIKIDYNKIFNKQASTWMNACELLITTGSFTQNSIKYPRGLWTGVYNKFNPLSSVTFFNPPFEILDEKKSERWTEALRLFNRQDYVHKLNDTR